jgi:hypothetical protein
MGADRIIVLTRAVKPLEFEAFLQAHHIAFYRKNESLWKDGHAEWETHMDVALDGDKLRLGFGYWSVEHTAECQREAKWLVRSLTFSKLIKNKGRWGY